MHRVHLPPSERSELWLILQRLFRILLRTQLAKSHRSAAQRCFIAWLGSNCLGRRTAHELAACTALTPPGISRGVRGILRWVLRHRHRSQDFGFGPSPTWAVVFIAGPEPSCTSTTAEVIQSGFVGACQLILPESRWLRTWISHRYFSCIIM